MSTILIVDDDPSLREVLEISLSKRKYSTRIAENVQEAMEVLNNESIDLALVDLRLGRESGIDLLRRIREKWSALPVLMITAYADSKSAVEAMKLGAKDYISKPFDVEELLLQVQRTLENSKIAEENAWLKEHIRGRYGPIIGESPKMQELYGLIKRIAPTPINVLITGESGTGKELIARALHNQSNRAQKPFIIINCGGLPENLVESELFGYRKGAFTGANKAKKGLLETADQGTLFLDEVGELQLSTQVKLLRCVQDGSFIPVGGTEEVSTDVRIIAATNRNIEKDVAEGNFREDLFYRLSGVIIKVPPLRERQDDVLLIAEYLLQRTCKEQNKHLEGFTSEAKAKLRRYNYPGNVRELENIIERAVALETGPFITPASLVIYENIQPVPSSSKSELVLEGKLSIDEYLDQEDCKILEEALERTGGHKGKAAKLVGLNFRQFRYRLSKHAEEISASGNSSPESAGEKQKKSD